MKARDAAQHPTRPPKQRAFLSPTPLVPRLRKPATPERTGGYISLRCRLELSGHHLVSPSPQPYQEPPLPTVLRRGSKHRGGKPSKKRHSQQRCEEPKAAVSLQSPALAARDQTSNHPELKTVPGKLQRTPHTPALSNAVHHSPTSAEADENPACLPGAWDTISSREKTSFPARMPHLQREAALQYKPLSASSFISSTL